MFAQVMAKKVKCSSSTLTRFVKAGKIKGERIVNKKTGHSAMNILTPIAEVQAILDKDAPRHGYKKNGSTYSKPSNLLQALVEWRAIPDAKRKILMNLSKHSIPELRILQELVK
jgi:hypothetical protein